MKKSAYLASWTSDPNGEEGIINVLVCAGLTEALSAPLQTLCLERQHQSWASECAPNQRERGAQEMLAVNHNKMVPH